MDKKLLLGSASPRRANLLEALGYSFELVKIECEEIYPSDLKVEEIPGYLSLLKANAYKDLVEGEILLTADTIVAYEGEVLGKPKEKHSARRMLQKLSGKSHQVITAVSLRSLNQTLSFSDTAEVKFSELSSAEIDYYIKQFAPFDKAGAYGIQEWIGMAKIEHIRGSYFTIMGLPTHLVYDHLTKWGVSMGL